MEERNEDGYLQALLSIEDLAEKKTGIYARLLIEPALAKAMEELSARHKEIKERLEELLYGKSKKDGGMSAIKGGNQAE